MDQDSDYHSRNSSYHLCYCRYHLNTCYPPSKYSSQLATFDKLSDLIYLGVGVYKDINYSTI